MKFIPIKINLVPLLAFTGLLVGMQAPAFSAAQPFVGEIQITGASYCPAGWAEANGQLLAINQNSTLYSLLGTAFGGDGRTTFQLPDYRGRIPAGIDTNTSSISLGQLGGEEVITPSVTDIPEHTHSATTTHVLFASSGRGRTTSPANAVLADDGNDNVYNSETPDVSLATSALTSSTIIGPADNSGWDNIQPYTTLNVCIALTGNFPARN